MVNDRPTRRLAAGSHAGKPPPLCSPDEAGHRDGCGPRFTGCAARHASTDLPSGWTRLEPEAPMKYAVVIERGPSSRRCLSAGCVAGRRDAVMRWPRDRRGAIEDTRGVARTRYRRARSFDRSAASRYPLTAVAGTGTNKRRRLSPARRASCRPAAPLVLAAKRAVGVARPGRDAGRTPPGIATGRTRGAPAGRERVRAVRGGWARPRSGLACPDPAPPAPAFPHLSSPPVSRRPSRWIPHPTHDPLNSRTDCPAIESGDAGRGRSRARGTRG